jgi:hypothetical protein
MGGFSLPQQRGIIEEFVVCIKVFIAKIIDGVYPSRHLENQQKMYLKPIGMVLDGGHMMIIYCQ